MRTENYQEENDFVSGSRVVLANEIGKWTQRLTSSYGLVLTISGQGCISFDKSTIYVERGDLLLLKPHWKHQFTPNCGWKYLWFHFLPRTHMINILDWPENALGTSVVHFSDEEFKKVYSTLQEAHELEYKRPQGWSLLAFLLLESVVVRGYTHCVNEFKKTDSWIAEAEKLLTETSKDMDEIASICNVSRATLYNKFKNAAGVSPRVYREYAILRRAVPLLENSELSIAEVAIKIGMPDPYYFSTRFRKFSGFSPREYRRKVLEKKSS